MSNYNCLTMMILRKCRANYEELTSLINRLAVDQLPGDLPAAVRLRYENGMTLEKTGQALGVNRERARQLESKAFRILRQPHRCRTFRAYFEEYLSAAPIHHVGVKRYLETWESEVEREALWWAEKELECR